MTHDASARNSRIALIVHGACGRVGRRLCELAAQDARFRLVGAVDRPGSPGFGDEVPSGGDRREVVKIAEDASALADVVVDFSASDGVRNALRIARARGSALLVGTTAIDAAVVDELRAEAGHRAVLVTPNTSLGVAVAARLVEIAARGLGERYDASIVESHHSRKKDAPSGTAIRLAGAARAGGARLDDAQIVSIRGGDVVGEHTVRLAGDGEYLEIVHRATSRDVFVRGALSAAAWLARRPAGWYTMENVLPAGGPA